MTIDSADECAELVERAGAMGVALDIGMATAMLTHLTLLEQWNRRLNLTAITDRARMRIEHVLDSLSVLPHLHGTRILDIGTGGGFPGLPLAVASPDREFTLLDSRGKRVEFVRYVVGRLGLANVSPVSARVERYRPEQKFDTLVCRAFAPLNEMISLSRSLQHPGTVLLAMKGRLSVEELSAVSASRTEGDRVSSATVVPLAVNGLNAERCLVRVELKDVASAS